MSHAGRSFLLAAAAVIGLAAAARAQFLDTRYVPTAGEQKELGALRDRLSQTVLTLRDQSSRTGVPKAEKLPDVEIFLEGVDRCLRQKLFFAPGEVGAARALLHEGSRRAALLAKGESPWERQPGRVVLGFRSRVDGSAQPYQVMVPENYSFTNPTPGRLDIFLHGRGGTLNEINFMASARWVESYFGSAKWPFLIVQPYGRSNNGWRWAGETDAFEALADVKRRYAVDNERVLLRGFSMGGHGTWHVGLQHPGDWAAMSPGAGFTDTVRYQKMAERLPDWQLKLLKFYDPVDWADNAHNLPVLAYCGDQDPALDQHVQMLESLRKAGAPYREFIGKDTPHRYEPGKRTEILEAFAGMRRTVPDRIRFSTWNLRFNRCRWVEITGMTAQFDKATVNAVRSGGAVTVQTVGVTALELGELPEAIRTITIDGQELRGEGDRKVSLVRRGDRWSRGTPSGLRKVHGLQGPIDDALFGPLLAVKGTGGAWSPTGQKWADAELGRFQEGFDSYFRGRLPVVDDAQLTARQVKDSNLYLFGDPGSNSVIRRIVSRLPIRWDREGFKIAGKIYSSAEHIPVMVFPNPENPRRYVVLNMGMTFSRTDWNGSNARQYAHLPDYAVLRIGQGEHNDNHRDHAVLTGFFNERWELR